MGIEPALAHGSLRMTVGHGTTENDIGFALAAFGRVVPRLRAAAGAQSASALEVEPVG